MNKTLRALWKHVARSIRDLAPIVLVITFFQYFILKAPLENAVDLISGAMLVLALSLAPLATAASLRVSIS